MLSPEAVPIISILLAARNEEHTILRCLQSLENLHYSTKKLEILIGDDQSEDQTALLITNFIRDKPQFRLYSITKRIGQQTGKANVLGQLAHYARGNYLFFTDADCAVPPSWIDGMLAPFNDPTIGIVTGCTQVSATSLFHRLQAIDWFYGQYVIKQLGTFGIPITAMGNNMAVRKQAYWEIGGYESLPFSVVEDYQLFNEIRRHGYRFAHRFDLLVLATTLPLSDWKEWFNQRKRWMVGALQLPFWFVLLFGLQLLFYPIVLLIAYWFPFLALLVWGTKFLIQSVQLVWILNRFNRWDLIGALIRFDLYFHLGYLAGVIYCFLSTKVIWKGRTY